MQTCGAFLAPFISVSNSQLHSKSLYNNGVKYNIVVSYPIFLNQPVVEPRLENLTLLRQWDRLVSQAATTAKICCFWELWPPAKQAYPC
jgi:hypothetical protein